MSRGQDSPRHARVSDQEKGVHDGDGRINIHRCPSHRATLSAPAQPLRALVLAPVISLTVTIESEDDKPAIHLHPGGQGFWIARMLETLGCFATLAGPVGGEMGVVARSLLANRGVKLIAVDIAASSPGYIHDRRGGARVELAEMPEPTLDRHELDDLYAIVLHESLAASTCVITGSVSGVLPPEMYSRLGSDLGTHSVRVIADVHGEYLEALLEGGPIDILKVSQEDLAADGQDVDDEESVVSAAMKLHERGAAMVVVSRGAEPSVAITRATAYRVKPPELEVVDHRGAGDSMTGALTAGRLMGLDDLDLIRLGSAAGAGNVLRHGLGSGRPELIELLSKLVEIGEIQR